MTSSEMASATSCTVKRAPTARCAVRSRATSRMSRPWARIRSPWNGGLRSFRDRRWAAPSRTSTDPGPRIGPITLAPADPKVAGSAAKTVRIAAGSPVTTMDPWSGRVIVKGSPYFAAQRESAPYGSRIMPTAAKKPPEGPGGRLVTALRQRAAENVAVDTSWDDSVARLPHVAPETSVLNPYNRCPESGHSGTPRRGNPGATPCASGCISGPRGDAR